LFTAANPGALPDGRTCFSVLNPDSVREVAAYMEPALAGLPAGTRVQFERTGYFCADKDGAPGRPVFNRTVSLKDSWSKMEKAAAPA
jgi:glutaminyl-tRNA synthetase